MLVTQLHLHLVIMAALYRMLGHDPDSGLPDRKPRLGTDDELVCRDARRSERGGIADDCALAGAEG